MKLIAAVVTAFALVVGAASGVLAYRAVVPDKAPVPATVAAPHRFTPKKVAVKQPPVRRLAPCKAPARLEHGACVTHVVKTVMLPSSPVQVAVVPVATSPAHHAAPQPATHSTGSGSDDGPGDGEEHEGGGSGPSSGHDD